MAFPWWLEAFQTPGLVCLRVKVVGASLVSTHCRGLSIALDHDFRIGEELSIFNGWLTEVSTSEVSFKLDIIPATRIVRLGEFQKDQVIEICSGLGGMTAAACALGLRSLACVDHSPLAVDACRRNHEGLALQGDICNPEDLASLFTFMKGDRMGLMCGFPCPPFSIMGDQKTFGDSRSEVFVAALIAAFLFNSAFVVLECTPTTGHHREVQDHLSSFARAMNFESRQQILRLSDLWPCQRTRWWCLLLPVSAASHISILPSLPKFPHLQSVGDIMPSWPIWSRSEEENHSWTPEEMDFYASTLILENHELRQSGTCPTLLHSLGHHLFACPCGCRRQGLSHERLLRDGVALTMLPSTFSANHYRHLRPCEAGYLCSLPADFIYNLAQARSDLPLIGQTAAPLQTMWVLLHALRAPQASGIGSWQIDFDSPNEALLNYIKSNLEVCKQLWPTCEHRYFQDIHFVEDDATFSRLIEPMTTVQHFPHAHQQLLGWPTGSLSTVMVFLSFPMLYCEVVHTRSWSQGPSILDLRQLISSLSNFMMECFSVNFTGQQELASPPSLRRLASTTSKAWNSATSFGAFDGVMPYGKVSKGNSAAWDHIHVWPMESTTSSSTMNSSRSSSSCHRALVTMCKLFRITLFSCSSSVLPASHPSF